MSVQHNQFYVTLPSNTAVIDDEQNPNDKTKNTVQNDKTKNMASNYTVKLPQRIRLDGSWEVGLAELIYPNTWRNLSRDSGQNIILLKYAPANEKVKVAIPPKRYETIEELVTAIEKALYTASDELSYKYPEKDKYTQLKMGISFVYKKDTHRVSLSLIPTVVKKIEMSDHLMYMLGLTKDQLHSVAKLDKAKDIEAASRVPDLRAGFECLYIYCDICDEEQVGNFLAPLLRVVNVQGNYGDVVDRIYDTPHYVPIIKKDITSIEINIKTDMGQFVVFAYGKVVVKLHFRRKMPALLF